MSVIENRREVAYRVFAAEFDDATLSYSEGDEERAPNYVVTPTGARVNRLFAVGALTEVESVNEEVLRGRIADPTGVFVTYAGQYQPEAMNFLDRATPPMFVSITGKARTYEPEDSDRVFTSVRPESVNEVDAGTRDRWVVAAARATLERVATMKAALAMDRRGDDLRVALEARGVDESLAAGVPLAIDHYGTTEHYLEAVRQMAVGALELVRGERDAVDSLTVDPGDVGPDELGPLPDVPAATEPEGGDVALTEVRESGDAEGSPDAVADRDGAESVTAADAEPTESDAGPESESDTDTATSADAGSPGTERETTEPGMETAAGDSSTPASEPESSEPEPTTEAPDADAASDPAEAEPERTAASATADAGGSASDAEPSGSTDGPGDFDESASSESESETTADGPTDSDDEPTGGLGDFDAGDAGSGDSDADAADAGDDESSATADEAAASSGEMYEMGDDERAELEEEFGAEFSTGNEVDDPGEAGIDVPDADELEAQAAEANAETNGQTPSTTDSVASASTGESDAATEEPAASPDDPRPDTQDPDAAAADSPETVDPSEEEVGAATADDAGTKATESADGADAETDGADAADVDLEDAVVEVMADLDDGDGADREAVVEAIVDRYGADPDDVEDAIQDALMSGKCYEPNEGTLKSI